MSDYSATSMIIEQAIISADITNNDMTNMQVQGTSQYYYQQSSHEPGLTDFNYEERRHLSLHDWINKPVSREKLARYGFYNIFEGDYVKCYFCEVVIGKWGVGDDPLTEHHKHSPDCEFINMKPTINVPIGDELSLQNEFKAMQEYNDLRMLDVTKCNTDLMVRHPDYKDEKLRLDSFFYWPKCMRQLPKDLSAAGFFYLGVGDEVKCFFCGGCLKDWEDTDSPIGEHKKWFYDQCHFIRKNFNELKKNYPKQYSKSLVKATSAQIMALTDYMSKHPDLKNCKIHSNNDKTLYHQMWNDLSEILNTIDGPRKDTNSWKEVWRNHKYNRKRQVSPISTPKRTDEEIPSKQTKMYHDFNEFPNHFRVERNPASTFQTLEVNHNNAGGLTSNNELTEYQPNLELSSCNVRTPGLHRNFELELNKQKYETDRLQFELCKLRNDIEQQRLKHQIALAEKELESFKTGNGIS